MTKVIFRKFRDGSVIALFPNIPWDNNGNIASYMHVGQHGGASPLIVADTKLAEKDEYAPLLRELKSLGYSNLKICKKILRR